MGDESLPTLPAPSPLERDNSILCFSTARANDESYYLSGLTPEYEHGAEHRK